MAGSGSDIGTGAPEESPGADLASTAELLERARGSYGGAEDGTITRPYDTVLEGFDAAGHGTDLSIRNGTYFEGPFRFYKRGRVTAREGPARID